MGISGLNSTASLSPVHSSWRRLAGPCVAKRLAAPDCDLLCVTKGYVGMLSTDGHLNDTDSNWDHAAAEGRREVQLWSQRPRSGVDPLTSDALPGERFVARTTETVPGPLLVVGVRIPWHDAHVRTGRKNRAGWRDHEAWLSGFATVFGFGCQVR